MPRRRLSPFSRRAQQFFGRPVYYARPERVGAPPVRRPATSVLGVAYTGVRRPCICIGCIVLTPSERERQRRVFALARAFERMKTKASLPVRR